MLGSVILGRGIQGGSPKRNRDKVGGVASLLEKDQAFVQSIHVTTRHVFLEHRGTQSEPFVRSDLQAFSWEEEKQIHSPR